MGLGICLGKANPFPAELLRVSKASLNTSDPTSTGNGARTFPPWGWLCWKLWLGGGDAASPTLTQDRDLTETPLVLCSKG